MLNFHNIHQMNQCRSRTLSMHDFNEIKKNMYKFFELNMFQNFSEFLLLPSNLQRNGQRNEKSTSQVRIPVEFVISTFVHIFLENKYSFHTHLCIKQHNRLDTLALLGNKFEFETICNLSKAHAMQPSKRLQTCGHYEVYEIDDLDC